jgi:hypothetical protein
MHTHLLKLAALTLVPAAILTITSCSSYKGTEQTTEIETPKGAIIVDTFTTMATVYSIDDAKREIQTHHAGWPHELVQSRAGGRQLRPAPDR